MLRGPEGEQLHAYLGPKHEAEIARAAEALHTLLAGAGAPYCLVAARAGVQRELAGLLPAMACLGTRCKTAVLHATVRLLAPFAEGAGEGAEAEAARALEAALLLPAGYAIVQSRVGLGRIAASHRRFARPLVHFIYIVALHENSSASCRIR